MADRNKKIEFLLDLKNRMSAALKAAEKDVQSSTGRMKSAFVKLGAAIGGAFAIHKIKDFLLESVRLAIDQERVSARLAQSFQFVGGISEEAAEQIEKQAAALQKLTGVSDNQIISAAALLGTFEVTGQQVQRLLPGLLDMAAYQERAGGAATDLNTIALALGKALGGTAGYLSRYGLVLTETQKKLWEHADATERVNILVEALRNNYGGAAEALGETFGGKLKVVSSLFGDYRERLGDAVVQSEKWRGVLDKLAQTLEGMIEEAEQGTGPLGELSDALAEMAEAGVEQLPTVVENLTDIVDLLTRPEVQALLKIGLAAKLFGLKGAGVAAGWELVQLMRDLGGAIGLTDEVIRGALPDAADATATVADTLQTLAGAAGQATSMEQRLTDTLWDQVLAEAAISAAEEKRMKAEKDLGDVVGKAGDKYAYFVGELHRVLVALEAERQLNLYSDLAKDILKVAESTGTAVEEIERYAIALYKAGLRGKELKDGLETLAEGIKKIPEMPEIRPMAEDIWGDFSMFIEELPEQTYTSMASAADYATFFLDRVIGKYVDWQEVAQGTARSIASEFQLLFDNMVGWNEDAARQIRAKEQQLAEARAELTKAMATGTKEEVRHWQQAIASMEQDLKELQEAASFSFKRILQDFVHMVEQMLIEALALQFLKGLPIIGGLFSTGGVVSAQSASQHATGGVVHRAQYGLGLQGYPLPPMVTRQPTVFVTSEHAHAEVISPVPLMEAAVERGVQRALAEGSEKSYWQEAAVERGIQKVLVEGDEERYWQDVISRLKLLDDLRVAMKAEPGNVHSVIVQPTVSTPLEYPQTEIIFPISPMEAAVERGVERALARRGTGGIRVELRNVVPLQDAVVEVFEEMHPGHVDRIYRQAIVPAEERYKRS